MTTASPFDFQTKPEICSYMMSLIPSGVVSVLEPTPGEGNIVRILNTRYKTNAPRDFWEVYKSLGRFDSVVMNPPFTPMEAGYKFLFACMELSDNVIALLPWLAIINAERRTKAIRDFGLRSVTHLPRSAFPGSRVQTCILQLKKGYRGVTSLHFWDDLRASK